MNLQERSLSELNELREQLENEINKRVATEKAEAIHVIQQYIAKFWLTPDDIFPKKARKFRVAKCQHPHDASLTWSGMGRKPAWVLRWIEGGGTMEELQQQE